MTKYTAQAQNLAVLKSGGKKESQHQKKTENSEGERHSLRPWEFSCQEDGYTSSGSCLPFYR